MEEINGVRFGTHRYYHGGHVYHLDQRGAINDTYRCAFRARLRCQGQVQVNGNDVIIIREHDVHNPNINILEEVRMKAELLRLCRETVRPIIEIYREVALRYDQAVVNEVTLRSMRSTMDRERYRGIPDVPLDLRILGTFIQNFGMTLNIYRGTATGTDGISALLFGSQNMIERLNDARKIFVSSIIRINAGPTRTYHMTVVYVRALETAVPMVYILFREKSKAQFLAVWRLLLELAPGLQENLQSAICAYDSALIGSLREVFTEITISGCWFFFLINLCTKWVQLRLATTPQNVLWMAVSLPLAPTARFAEGLESIIQVGDLSANEHPSILLFLRYLRQWLPLSDLISASRESLADNDLCETFHRYIVKKLCCPNRNLWAFFGDRLNAVMEQSEAHWQAPAGNNRRRTELRETARISRIQDQLSAGRLDMPEFLNNISDHRRRTQVSGIVIGAIQEFDGNAEVDLERNDFVRRPVADDNIVAAPADREIPNLREIPEAVIEENAANEESDNEDFVGDPNDPIFQPDFGRPLDYEDREDIAINDNPQNNDREIAAVAEDQQGPVTFEQRACSACLEARPRVVYNNCGHLAVCETCDRSLVTRECPLCRAFITSTTKVYYA